MNDNHMVRKIERLTHQNSVLTDHLSRANKRAFDAFMQGAFLGMLFGATLMSIITGVFT